jgi:hypothetical protein
MPLKIEIKISTSSTVKREQAPCSTDVCIRVLKASRLGTDNAESGRAFQSLIVQIPVYIDSLLILVLDA